MRPLGILRTAYGLALLLAPAATAAALTGRTEDDAARHFTRVLGARQAIQGATLGRLPARAAWIGAGIDAVHAATALALVRADGRHRHLLRANAAIAAALAADGVARCVSSR